MRNLLQNQQCLFHFIAFLLFPALTMAQQDMTFQKGKTGKKLTTISESSWMQKATTYLNESEYFFQKSSRNCFAAINRKQNTATFVTANGFKMQTLTTPKNEKIWNVGFNLNSITKGKQIDSHYVKPEFQIKEKELRVQSDQFVIQYINNEQGFRQNFIINKRPEGKDPLTVSLNITGGIARLENPTKLLVQDESSKKVLLYYDGLLAWDANGKILKSSMKIQRNGIDILVDDKDAAYPVTIDPLTHTPEWTASADAVLPGLLNNFQLQVNALLGYSVEGVGDINNDGFDDVAIGAPGAIDVIAGPSTIVGAGAVFIYYGSPSGLSTMPDKVLRATTPIANALFGFSISSGNVTGDSRKDLVIGAPGDSYVANVGGLPSSATVTAGKVYIFRGEDLSAAGNPSPFLSVYLNGSTFFSNGIAGVIAANVNVNALFGFSVSVSDDLDGDGYGDIIVGSPGYAGLNLISIRSGAAYVFYSSSLSSNTPVSLEPPSSGLLGIANLDGLLFGFSVDGAGDYNKDGNADVVVGAPAGVGILSNLLGGSAYVYNGNGSGIKSTFSTQLTAGGSLLGSVANLFGYKVKGVTDDAGKRNGNILAGAPAGNVLSNVLNGLRLKTGSIDVFLAKSAPSSSEIADQTFTSPRSGNLLSILAGQNLNINALFGASIDNMLDVNCDGINDIIVGEPLSTGIGIINTNAVGGAAYVFLGKADGTYDVSPNWTLENTVAFDLGVNAGSLLGYCVSGARHVKGISEGVRALVGAPGQALDFSSGIFNFGATFGTLYSFLATNDNLGKAYSFPFAPCSVLPIILNSFNAVVNKCDVSLGWSLLNRSNLKNITIESSLDGVNFKSVSAISQLDKDIYTQKVEQKTSVAYYRLKITDAEGKYFYSDITSAKISCTVAGQLSVYPNPVSESSKLIFYSPRVATASLMVYDMSGKIITNKQVIINEGYNDIPANLSSLNKGAYFIRIIGTDWKSDMVKIIK